MQGDDLLPLEQDGLDGGHADVFEALEVGQVALPEGHKEADALDARDVEREALDLLVVQQVHILFADAVKVVLALDLHRLCLHPMAVLPIRAVGGYFADVDLWVEVGRKG